MGQGMLSTVCKDNVDLIFKSRYHITLQETKLIEIMLFEYIILNFVGQWLFKTF